MGYKVRAFLRALREGRVVVGLEFGECAVVWGDVGDGCMYLFMFLCFDCVFLFVCFVGGYLLLWLICGGLADVQ